MCWKIISLRFVSLFVVCCVLIEDLLHRLELSATITLSPNSTQFLMRVRLIQFGVNPEALFDRSPVDYIEEDDYNCSTAEEFVQSKPDEDLLTDAKQLLQQYEDQLLSDEDVSVRTDLSSTQQQMQTQGFAYVSGYVASTLKKEPEMTWVEDKSNTNEDFD